MTAFCILALSAMCALGRSADGAAVEKRPALRGLAAAGRTPPPNVDFVTDMAGLLPPQAETNSTNSTNGTDSTDRRLEVSETGSTGRTPPPTGRRLESHGILATGSTSLDKMTFFFQNYEWTSANMCMWEGFTAYWAGTEQVWRTNDQLWTLYESSKYPGYYEIQNAYWTSFRLCKWGKDGKKTGVYDKNHYEDQLWKIEEIPSKYRERGDGKVYRITNKYYDDEKLTMWGSDSEAFGTSHYSPEYDGQFWTLVPRYNGRRIKVVVYEADNLQGTQDLTEEKTITTGLIKTREDKITVTEELETSLTAAIPDIGGSAAAKFKATISYSVSQKSQSSWTKKIKYNFSAPAGYYYRVSQWILIFSSEMHNDDLTLVPYDGKFIVEQQPHTLPPFSTV